MFDDDEGDDWLQLEPDDWWQQEPDDLDMPTDEVDGAVDQEGESVQAALNSRLKRSTRMVFFDDESGDEEMQQEPDDVNLVACMVDKRGWSEFSKAAKLTGAWRGMVFKRGPLGLGYYRDEFKLDLSLAEDLTAKADAAPVTVKLEDLLASKPDEKTRHVDEPETCPREETYEHGQEEQRGRAGD